MEVEISRSVKREDVPDKIAGKTRYIGDFNIKGMLYAKTFRSTVPRARIKSLEYPELPDGYYIVDKNDVPGINGVKMLTYDQPFFADGVVNYVGEPIALIVGRDKEKIEEIHSRIKIEYEIIDPILSYEEGIDPSNPIYEEDNLFADYRISKGSISKAKEKAAYVYEGEYETGYQEQFYMEPQGVIGIYEDGKITVYGSLQCPYYVKGALEECLGFTGDRVRVVQASTGGAFGGKEDFPSLIAGQVACAALKAKKPVCLIYERKEDIESTTKRHPSKIRLKSYIDGEYRLLGMEVDILLDSGAYAGLSSVVLQRAMFASTGVYNVENIEVRGRAFATNKAVSGAFRGFGGPQAFFAVEMHMEHTARKLKIDPLEFKIKNMLKQGDLSTTGGRFRDRIRLHEMIERAQAMSNFHEKRRRFNEERREGKLKGIGLSTFFHGGGFTGSGERDYIKAKVKLVKYPNEVVELFIANTEMGQGLQTVLRKIASHTLGIPLEKVIYKNPDTDRVPDSGPTVASRSTVIVGKLVQRAAEELKRRWNEEGNVEAFADFEYPKGFEWDGDRFKGDAYNSYSWGVNVVEVEIDPISLSSEVKGVWAVFDVGSPIDERIVKGQIDGGIVQGLGYAGIEVIENVNGSFKQRSSSDYTIPTSMDVPKIHSELICEPYGDGPYGAKGLGELTLIGAAPAYALAVEDALKINLSSLPVRPEHLMEVVENEI